MFRRIVFLSCVQIVAFGSYLSAQDMTNAQLTAEVRTIKSQLAGVSSNVTKALETVSENATQLHDLKIRVDTLSETINEEIRKQQQILTAISERDSTGRYVPRLSAAMESETFRKDMQDAVQRSIQRDGDFVVTNKTGQYTRIFVNKYEIGISPGETKLMKVPVGTVTTQLTGQEKETWTVTAPTYVQKIDIVPVSSPPTSTFGTPIYVNPPIYSNTPIYFSPITYPSAPVLSTAYYSGVTYR